MPHGDTGDVTDVLPSHVAPHTPPLLLTEAVIGSGGCVPAALSPSQTPQSAGEGTRVVTLHGAGQVSLGSPRQTCETGGYQGNGFYIFHCKVFCPHFISYKKLKAKKSPKKKPASLERVRYCFPGGGVGEMRDER